MTDWLHCYRPRNHDFLLALGGPNKQEQQLQEKQNKRQKTKKKQQQQIAGNIKWNIVSDLPADSCENHFLVESTNDSFLRAVNPPNHPGGMWII